MSLNIKNTILALLFLSVLISVLQLTGRTVQQQAQAPGTALHSLAEQFMPLQKVFANVPRAGYYTDKNMDIPLAVAQFEQAQFVLAPTVLELNNTNLPLVIFDCTSPAIAMQKIKEL